MIPMTLPWIAGFVAVNLLALAAALRLAFARERVPAAPKAEDTYAPRLVRDTAADTALRDLVGEIDRIEASHAGSPRGEARLAAEVERWRDRGGGRGWPRPAASCRAETPSPAERGRG